MHRIMLRVAYDGTDYCGWQFQPGVPTIEGELNRALSEMLKEEIVVTGASRTDAGVHSRGNVCVFDTARSIPPEKVAQAVNTKLPDNIIVTQSRQVPDDFHPRHCDYTKTYEYRILNSQTDDPLTNRYTYHFPRELDVNLMKEAAKYIEGEHDFTSFCAVASDALSHVRTVYSVVVTKQGDEIKIQVSGNGFLYNMVRIIAGTLIQVGIGKIKPIDIKAIINGCDRRLAGPTAPAKGLTQVNIEYSEELLAIKEE